MRKTIDSLYVLLVLLVLSGCGGQNGVTVSGNVTLDGVPITTGRISFMPVDTKTGQAVGGEVANGAYTVRGVSAGKQRVNVTVDVKGRTMANAQKYKAYEHSGGKQGEKPPIPELANALGNDQIQEIAAGSSQVLNLSLHKVDGPEPTLIDRSNRRR